MYPSSLSTLQSKLTSPAAVFWHKGRNFLYLGDTSESGAREYPIADSSGPLPEPQS